MTDDEILRIEEAHAQECAQYADRIAELEVLLQNAVADAEEFQWNYARACHLIALAKEGEQASTNSVQLLLERAIIAEARAEAAEAEAARMREVAYITAEKEKERIDRLFARIEHYQRKLIKFQGIAARLLEYDERNGPLNFQYEKLCDFLREFEAMLPKCDRATDAALNPPAEETE